MKDEMNSFELKETQIMQPTYSIGLCKYVHAKCCTVGPVSVGGHRCSSA